MFGRIQIIDDRDGNYPMSALLAKAEKDSTKTSRYWYANGWWGDQGGEPQCVAYAWLHWAEDGPVTQVPLARGADPVMPPGKLYKQAQKMDEWPGENYAGTSVRAGAKVLQQYGVIRAYYWAARLREVIDAILFSGPVVVGTDWYEGMMDLDPDGKVHPTGRLIGGHAYVLNGVNTKKSVFRLKNSWGKEWGKGGHAIISFRDFRTLLQRNGEACLASEVRI